MSTDFFKKFPKVLYTFGDENTNNLTSFQNLSVYVEVLDIIKDAASAYTYYHLVTNERPDQVSYKLYGSTDYYWTFYLLNDHIREQGWALSNEMITKKAIDDHPDKILTTTAPLVTNFKIGQRVIGLTSAAYGTVAHRNVDLGQLALHDVVGTFRAGENIISSYGISPGIQIGAVTAFEDEYLSAHHYEDADGNYVDIDPTVGPGALYNEVTHLDHYIRLNDSLKIIKVIKPENILEISRAFNDALVK